MGKCRLTTLWILKEGKVLSENHITSKMVEDGLIANVIRPSLENGELIITIGDYFFIIYNMGKLDGETVFSLTPKIFAVLEDFYNCPDTYDNEYNYYFYYLIEHI